MKHVLCNYYIAGLVVAVEDLKMNELLVPISFGTYHNIPKPSGIKQQAFILLSNLDQQFDLGSAGWFF